MVLADRPELDEGDQSSAEDPDEVSAKTHDDARQPNGADADGDGGVQRIDLFGMELVKQIEDPERDREQPKGQQQYPSRDEEWAAAQAEPRRRLHCRPSYGGSPQRARSAVKFSLD